MNPIDQAIIADMVATMVGCKILDWKEYYDLLTQGGATTIPKSAGKAYINALIGNNCVIVTGHSGETAYMRPISVVAIHDADAVIALFDGTAGNRGLQSTVVIMGQEDGTYVFQCETTT